MTVAGTGGSVGVYVDDVPAMSVYSPQTASPDATAAADDRRAAAAEARVDDEDDQLREEEREPATA